MKRKECGRKPSLYNVRYHPDIYLKGLRKATNTTVSVTGLLGPLSYEAGIPTTRLCRSVFSTISEVKELCYYLHCFRNSLKIDVEHTHSDKFVYMCDGRNKHIKSVELIFTLLEYFDVCEMASNWYYITQFIGRAE
jgi:hypothetical protein